MMQIKAIETRYKGYRFRSRLEARWAVFFDALGIRWEYEKEGYDLGAAGWYLPDFWLPDQRYWFEVKPSDLRPLPDAINKAFALAVATKRHVFVAPGMPELGALYWFRPDEAFQHNSEYFTGMSWCHNDSLGYKIGAVGMSCDDWDQASGFSEFTTEHPSIIGAYTAARAARFEHGEEG